MKRRLLALLIGHLLAETSAFANTPLLTLKLELDPIAEATAYELEATSGAFQKTFTSNTEHMEIKVPVGEYMIRIRSKDRRGIFGDWSEPEKIQAEPSSVDLQKSEQLFRPHIEAEGLRYWVELEWIPVAGASGYRFLLKSKASGKEEIVAQQTVKNPKIKFKTKPGRLTYNVQALYSEGQVASPLASYEPKLDLLGKKLNAPRLLSQKELHIQWQTDDHAGLLVESVYCEFLSTTCTPIGRQIYQSGFDFAPTKGPGIYKLALVSHIEGYVDSDPVHTEFIVKPKEEDLP